MLRCVWESQPHNAKLKSQMMKGLARFVMLYYYLNKEAFLCLLDFIRTKHFIVEVFDSDVFISELLCRFGDPS